MLSTSVIIRKITNLTDARYFAARGADYITFSQSEGDISYCSPAAIKEMRTWIEGPKIIFEYGLFDPIPTNINELVDGILITENHLVDSNATTFMMFSEPEKLKHPIESFITPILISESRFCEFSSDIIKSIYETQKDKIVYLQMPNMIEGISKIQNILPNFGLVFTAGQEEKIGFKSFDDFDEIFDLLEKF